MSTKRKMQGRGDIVQWDGKIISRPGIYKGVPLDLYHSSELFDGKPAASSSALRMIVLRSAEHYWCESPYNPKRVDPEDKKQFIVGRALHHLVGGEKFFASLFSIRPENIFDPKEQRPVPWNGNRTVCKAWLEREAKGGRSVLTPEDAENLQGMALSLGRHPAVGQGLLRGHVELSYFWIDEETGVWCKWRPDSTPPGSLDFIDLKTTTDVRYPKLMKTLADYAYYAQGGFGRIACRTLLGRELETFTLMFVEKKPPWSISLMSVKQHMLERGEMLCRAGLRRFATCWQENNWPGPAESDIGHLEISERELGVLDEILKTHGLNPA